MTAAAKYIYDTILLFFVFVFILLVRLFVCFLFFLFFVLGVGLTTDVLKLFRKELQHVQKIP